MLESSEDPIRAAVKVAIAGNVIDLGADPDFDLAREMKGFLSHETSIDDYKSFHRSLESATRFLYFGDNAGEIFLEVFHGKEQSK